MEINRYSSIDVVVNVEHGLGLSASSQIVQECSKYGRTIYIFNKEFLYGGYADGRRVIDIMGLGAAKGHELQIFVEGDDEEAEEILLKLYNGIRSEHKWDMKFEKERN